MESSGRFWTPVVLLIILVAAIYTYRHLDEVDKANAALLNSRKELTEARELLSLRKREHDQYKTKVDDASNKLRQAQSRLEAARKQMDAASQKERGLDGELKYLLGSLPQAIMKTRNASAPTPIAELQLKDGKILKNAVLKKVEDDVASFFHNDGYSSIPASNLPNDIIETYDLGPNSMVKLLEGLSARAKQSETSDPGKTVATPAKSSTSVPAPATPETNAADPKAKVLKDKIFNLDVEIGTTNNAVKSFEAQANNNNTAAENARSKGTPSTRYAQAAQAATQQVQTLKAKLLRLEAERNKAQLELSEITGIK